MDSSRVRILVVEDDDLVRRAVVRALERDGAVVVAVGSCAEARDAGRFDLGIFDVDLPDGEGVVLAQELIRSGQVEHVVFFTGGSPERPGLAGPVVAKASGMYELRRVVQGLGQRVVGPTI